MARYFSRSLVAILCQASLGGGVLLGSVSLTQAKDIQFNTDILDIKDRSNIDLSQFTRKGFILPGTYDLGISLNEQNLPARPVSFLAPDDDPKGSQACLTPELVEQLGLTDTVLKGLTWWHQDQCLDVSSLKGMEIRGDLASNTLFLSIPQAYLEYSSMDWDPPSRWEEGIPGLLLDYNLNGQTQRQNDKDNRQTNTLSGNGVAGANLGPWRLRASWQTRLSHETGAGQASERSLDWTQYTAYRAITPLRARLTLGEDYLNSDIFSNFRFTGASLVSDDNMLPPNLRGYAPEVSGVARGNAKVVISQQGRVIKEVLVASGPFRIQDLDSAVSGALDVRVEEADGSVQRFQVETATIPYLTRPGQVRFKLASGRPSDWQHHANGPLFATGEFSWGISNGWSLYGGGLGGEDYTALSLGVGRDLLALGALSADVTQSQARLPQGARRGGSYRLSYSKRFDATDSQVTFAGYRFSDNRFMSMEDFLSARQRQDGATPGRSKEMYTVSFNQQFQSLGLSAYLSYNHQTYWNQATSDRYNLSVARYFDLGRFRNLSLSLTAYRSRYDRSNDDGMYLSLSLPWGNAGSLSYNSDYHRNDNRHTVSYYNRPDEANNYQLSTGVARSGADLSGYYTHEGSLARVDGSASYRQGAFTSVGLSLAGGITLTPEGGAMHRSNLLGGTRMLIDTDGVAGVPVGGYGSTVNSNYFGKAVVSDVNSYYRNSVRIDVDKLADNAQATRSVVQGTLTEGAIGYRHFEVVAGEKAMAVIRLADGTYPPFGATVLNRKRQETGLVNDAGNVYLSGIQAGESMTVHWNGGAQCRVTLPAQLPALLQTSLLLPCVKGELAQG